MAKRFLVVVGSLGHSSEAPTRTHAWARVLARAQDQVPRTTRVARLRPVRWLGIGWALCVISLLEMLMRNDDII